MRECGSITNLLLFLRSKLETTETMLQTDNVDKVGTANKTQDKTRLVCNQCQFSERKKSS